MSFWDDLLKQVTDPFYMFRSHADPAPPLPSIPQLTDPSVTAAGEAVRQSQAKRKGRSSTLLTGGLAGDPTISSSGLWGR